MGLFLGSQRIDSATGTVGVANGTDQSTVLQAAADALAALGGGTLRLPSGTIVGHVTIGASVIVSGQGMDATILKRPNGWNGPVISAAGWSTLVRSGTTGTLHDLAVRDLTIDGNRAAGGFTVPLPGAPATPTATTSTTGGTLTAGTKVYRVAALTDAGVSPVSQRVQLTTTGSTSTVTVNWTAVTGATGYVVYGRTFGERKLVEVGAVTTWTDDGSITPSILGMQRGGNATAPAAVALYGWRPSVRSVRIKNAPGPGLHIVWPATGAGLPNESNEAALFDVHVERSGTNNLILQGPHDSTARSVFAVQPGAASQVDVSTVDNVAVEAGPWRFAASHAWGQARYAFAMYGQTDLTACQAEGAMVAQAFCYCPDLHINGLEVFAPGTGTAKGVMFGDSEYTAVQRVNISGLHAYGFESGGAAVDMTLVGPSSSIEGTITQTSGTAVVGAPLNDSYVNLRVSGGGKGSIFQIPGYPVDLWRNAGAATMTRRESNATLSGFASGIVVAGLVSVQASQTYTKARVYVTGVGTAVTGVKVGAWSADGLTLLSESADFTASLALNAWVTVTLGTPLTLNTGDQINLGLAEAHTTTSISVRGLGPQVASFWPATTAEGAISYRGRAGGTYTAGSALPASVSAGAGPGVVPLIELIP